MYKCHKKASQKLGVVVTTLIWERLRVKGEDPEGNWLNYGMWGDFTMNKIRVHNTECHWSLPNCHVCIRLDMNEYPYTYDLTRWPKITIKALLDEGQVITQYCNCLGVALPYFSHPQTLIFYCFTFSSGVNQLLGVKQLLRVTPKRWYTPLYNLFFLLFSASFYTFYDWNRRKKLF